LLDRGAERTTIDKVLDAVRGRFSGVLVLRGDPGVGKTTLACYASEAASGFHVSPITGVESEINLEYGAVHQLLVPFLPLIGDLPGPQRHAIGVAFGLEAGPPPNSFLVAPASRCSRARLLTSRYCAWSMTCTGSMQSRRWCSDAWRAVFMLTGLA
jgi:hypothetical protein